MLIKRLYCYLDATTVLDQNAVNPVLLEIAHDGLAVEFASDMRFDAYKIYCDEAYHALFSIDLKKTDRNDNGRPRPRRPEWLPDDRGHGRAHVRL